MGWKVYKNGTLDKTIGITANTDGTADIDFPENNTAIDITYVVEYTEGGNCGRAVVEQPGCRSGTRGKTCDSLDITEASSTKLVPKEGGVTLNFSHSPVPVEPVGECKAKNFTLHSPTTEAALSIALECTKTSTRAKKDNGYTVIIENYLDDYYIPYNGMFKLPGTDVFYRNETGPGHSYCGQTKDRIQDTNFLVPPHTKVTLKNCSSTTNTYPGKAFFTISLLKSSEGDFLLHNDHVEQCYDVILNSNAVTFKIRNAAIWSGDENGCTSPISTEVRRYGIKFGAGEKCVDAEGWTVGASGKRRYIVPINIYRSVKNDWSGYDPSSPVDDDMVFTPIT